MTASADIKSEIPVNSDSDELHCAELFLCNHCGSKESKAISIDARNWRCVNYKFSRIRTMRQCDACKKFTTYRMSLKQHARDMSGCDVKNFFEMKDTISADFFPTESEEDMRTYKMELEKYD